MQTDSEPSHVDPSLEIVAYSAWGFQVPLVPAFFKRDWMDETAGGFAYHCLPMTLANQSGWFVLAPHGAVAEWNGGMAPTDLKVTIEGRPDSVHAMSAVGSGILSWTIPYIFRTPPGWNLLCRGPSNYIKDGIQALEGLVETDWSFASFSSNWKMTRPGRVEFQAGEPVAMLVPVRKAELASNPELFEGYTEWINSRQAFLSAQRNGDAEEVPEALFLGPDAQRDALRRPSEEAAAENLRGGLSLESTGLGSAQVSGYNGLSKSISPDPGTS
jgi:hypothetical protein